MCCVSFWTPCSFSFKWLLQHYKQLKMGTAKFYCWANWLIWHTLLHLPRKLCELFPTRWQNTQQTLILEIVIWKCYLYGCLKAMQCMLLLQFCLALCSYIRHLHLQWPGEWSFTVRSKIENPEYLNKKVTGNKTLKTMTCRIVYHGHAKLFYKNDPTSNYHCKYLVLFIMYIPLLAMNLIYTSLLLPLLKVFNLHYRHVRKLFTVDHSDESVPLPQELRIHSIFNSNLHEQWRRF